MFCKFASFVFTVTCNFCSNDSIFFVDRILNCWINFDNFFLNRIDDDEDIDIDHLDDDRRDDFLFVLSDILTDVDLWFFNFNSFVKHFVDRIRTFFDFVINCLEDVVNFFRIDFFFDFLTFDLNFFNRVDIDNLLKKF